jgi:ribosome-binding factor A
LIEERLLVGMRALCCRLRVSLRFLSLQNSSFSSKANIFNTSAGIKNPGPYGGLSKEEFQKKLDASFRKMESLYSGGGIGTQYSETVNDWENDVDTKSGAMIRRRNEVSEALTEAIGASILEFTQARERERKRVCDLRLCGFSIRRVALSANFADANVYWYLREADPKFVNPYPNTPLLDQVQSICNKCIPSIRYHLQYSVNLKYAPKVHFRFDSNVPMLAKFNQHLPRLIEEVKRDLDSYPDDIRGEIMKEELEKFKKDSLPLMSDDKHRDTDELLAFLSRQKRVDRAISQKPGTFITNSKLPFKAQAKAARDHRKVQLHNVLIQL